MAKESVGGPIPGHEVSEIQDGRSPENGMIVSIKINKVRAAKEGEMTRKAQENRGMIKVLAEIYQGVIEVVQDLVLEEEMTELDILGLHGRKGDILQQCFIMIHTVMQ